MKANYYRRILSLAVPMTSVQFIASASGFLCMTMLSRLGHDVLAASALIFSIQMSIMVMGMSVLMSLSVLVGHAFGAKQDRMIGNFVQQAWLLAILISIPIMFLFWHIGPVLIFFKQAPLMVAIVQTYFHAYFWAVPPILLSIANQQFCFGIQKQKLALLTSILSVAVLLVTAYLFIFGKCGAPDLGVAGLGYAMAIQSCFGMLFLGTIFFRSSHFKRFELFRFRIHQDLNALARMFQLGWPISVQMGGEMLSFLFVATMVGWLGTSSLAAYQVVNQYLFVLIIPIFGLSSASGILVGQAFGSKQVGEVKKLGLESLKLAALFTMVIAFIMLCFPRELASLYFNIHNPANFETLHTIVGLFAIVGITQIFDATRNVMMGSLRGLFDTRYPMYVAILVVWVVGMPLAYFMGFSLHWGIIGLLIGARAGMLIGAVLLLLRFWRRAVVLAVQPRKVD